MATINPTTKGIKLTDKDDIQMYVYGGKGEFKLKSLTSNVEITYKIKPISKYNKNYDEYTFYVSLVVEGGYNKFMGVMKTEDNKYIHSKKSELYYNSPEVKGFRWLLEQFNNDKPFNAMMEFYHMGVCSCCARTLTTPESIKMGIGSVCFEKYGNERLKKLLKLKKKIEQKIKLKAKKELTT